jgi:ribose 5-phosphate isomerase A
VIASPAGSGHLPLAAPAAIAYKRATAPERRQEGPMTAELSPIDTAKFAAAKRAVEFVESGMKLGLGTGSTAAWMVRALAERVRATGLKVTCVPTSRRTGEQAQQLGLTLATLDEAKWLDLTIDGADEFDPQFNLIKGGGAALLQEKIVAAASERMIVIADGGKEVATLGAFPLPVEVIPFGWQSTRMLIEELLIGQDVLGRDCTLRLSGEEPLRTDENNFILDLHLKRIGNPRQLALALNQIPGVVENGLFIDLCDMVVVGHGNGRVEVRDATSGSVSRSAIAPPDSGNIFREGEG